MKGKDAVTGILVIVIVAAGITAITRYIKNSDRNALAERIASVNRGAPPETIEGLKAAIAEYEKQIERYVKDAAQVGVYWKILATRLQDKGLYNESLKALERAIYYTPEDPGLHCLTGECAGRLAKSVHDFSGSGEGERERLYALSEEAYLRAIELDGRYLRPKYGLAVLYVFELDRPAEAIPHLQKYLEISKSDVDAMFVLARAYYMTENYQAAVDTYDRIIALTKDANKRAEAENNKNIAARKLYG
jgi:tetratricopeptide (TPR) repeat protein